MRLRQPPLSHTISTASATARAYSLIGSLIAHLLAPARSSGSGHPPVAAPRTRPETTGRTPRIDCDLALLGHVADVVGGLEQRATAKLYCRASHRHQAPIRDNEFTTGRTLGIYPCGVPRVAANQQHGQRDCAPRSRISAIQGHVLPNLGPSWANVACAPPAAFLRCCDTIGWFAAVIASRDVLERALVPPGTYFSPVSNSFRAPIAQPAQNTFAAGTPLRLGSRSSPSCRHHSIHSARSAMVSSSTPQNSQPRGLARSHVPHQAANRGTGLGLVHEHGGAFNAPLLAAHAPGAASRPLARRNFGDATLKQRRVRHAELPAQHFDVVAAAHSGQPIPSTAFSPADAPPGTHGTARRCRSSA